MNKHNPFTGLLVISNFLFFFPHMEKSYVMSSRTGNNYLTLSQTYYSIFFPSIQKELQSPGCNQVLSGWFYIMQMSYSLLAPTTPMGLQVIWTPKIQVQICAGFQELKLGHANLRIQHCRSA